MTQYFYSELSHDYPKPSVFNAGKPMRSCEFVRWPSPRLEFGVVFETGWQGCSLISGDRVSLTRRPITSTFVPAIYQDVILDPTLYLTWGDGLVIMSSSTYDRYLIYVWKFASIFYHDYIVLIHAGSFLLARDIRGHVWNFGN